jgi:hypothetical protein
VRPEPLFQRAKIENEPSDHDGHAIDLGCLDYAFALGCAQILDEPSHPACDVLATRQEMHHDDSSRRGHCVE